MQEGAGHDQFDEEIPPKAQIKTKQKQS